MKYRALSLWQPWASAIFEPNQKTIETRSYPVEYRGRIYIHATLWTKTVERAWLKLIHQPGFAEAVKNPFYQFLNQTPCGMILGHVDLVDCMEAAEYHKYAENSVSREELNLNFLWGDLSSGRYAWILKNPVKFDSPIPAKGLQNFGWDCEKYLPEYAKLL